MLWNIFQRIFWYLIFCLFPNVKERERGIHPPPQLTIAAGWISFHWPQSEPLIGHCASSATRNCLFTEKSNYRPPALNHSHLSLLHCKRYFHGYFDKYFFEYSVGRNSPKSRYFGKAFSCDFKKRYIHYKGILTITIKLILVNRVYLVGTITITNIFDHYHHRHCCVHQVVFGETFSTPFNPLYRPYGQSRFLTNSGKSWHRLFCWKVSKFPPI